MSRSYTSSPPGAFMECSGTALHYYYYYALCTGKFYCLLHVCIAQFLLLVFNNDVLIL
jgi:hypothetical protein